METNLNRVAEDLFDKIEGFPNIVLKDQNNQPIPPSMEDQIENARIFNFNFITDGVNLGPVTVTISDNDGLQIKTYNDPVEGKPEKIQDSWYAFIKSLSEFATEHVIKFKGPKIVTQKITAKSEVGESKMTESKLVGTSKTSYQDLGEATLIVKHSKPINYNAANGRTQHIERIYIENAMGERFCYPFKHLNGARALATHIVAGGTPYDDIGQHVIGLSEELNKLRMFKGYVTRSPMVAEAMGAVTDKVFNRIEGIKKELHHLQSKNYYAEWSEGFSKTEAKIIPEDMAAEWIDRLTIKTFNEDLKTVFPYLLNIIEESDLPTVELDAEALLNSFAQVQELADPKRDIQELVDLENFVDTLIKEDIDDGIFSTDPEQRAAAIAKLNELIRENPEATLGLGGENGKRMLADIMNDDALMAEIDERAEQNQGSAESLWDVVRDYLEFKSPEMLKDNGGEIDFNPEPATAPATEPAEPAAAPVAEPAPAAPAEPVPQQEGWQSGLEQRLGKIKSLAEQNGRDFDSINLNINGKSYSLSEALSAFNLDEGGDSIPSDQSKLSIGQQMARDGITYSPEKEDELIGLMAQYMKKDGMSRKAIRYYLSYDEDFIPDQLSDLPKEGMADDDSPPWDTDDNEISPFKKPNNPNRTGRDSASALAQKGLAQAEKKSLAKEIQEMVKSFTNLVPERMDQGPFPLGEEGVVTKVTKDMCEKFGKEDDERFKMAVETYCRETVGKLSAVYETSRMKKLAGMDSAVDESSEVPYQVKHGPEPMAMTSPRPTAIVASKKWTAITPDIEAKAHSQGFRKVMLKVNGQLVPGLEGGDQKLGSKIIVAPSDFENMTRTDGLSARRPMGVQSAEKTGIGSPAKEEIARIRELSGIHEVGLDGMNMDVDQMFKNISNQPGATKTSNFKSNINGKQDDSEAGYNAVMGKFGDMSKGMGFGADGDDPVGGMMKGIQDKFGNMTKSMNMPTVPGVAAQSPIKQDPKAMLKALPDAKISTMNGDEAKKMLADLKKMAGL
jgi:hypothetical protein